MVLCRFFSCAVGNCEEIETTEGLDRRPREPEESLLSFVDRVEVLVDGECLLSIAEIGDKVSRSFFGQWIPGRFFERLVHIDM